MQLYKWEPLTLSHLPAKFDGHRHCGSGDMFLICHVTIFLKGYVPLRVKFPHGKSPPCHVWHPLVYCNWRFNILNLSRDFTRPRDWSIKWRYEWKLLIVCQHPAKFGGHRHRDSGEMLLICHVVSQGHGIKGPRNIMSGSMDI